MSGSDIIELDDDGGLELPDAEGSVDFRSDWKIFIPTIVILISYGLSMLYLWATGRVDGALFRLAALIAGIGVPLLAAHAFLRLETICVRFFDDSIHFHEGWPKKNATIIPYDLITKLSVKRGIFGNLFGGGTLIITTKGGVKTAISDLKSPDAAVSVFEEKRS